MIPARVIDAVVERRVTAEDIRAFAKGIAEHTISDAQCAAFAMAVKLRGLSPAALSALTFGMRDSGRVLSWDLPGPTVDKHSTGGVGDLVSLVLAPALAACGVFVPMIAGRGLAHTGGTLDKLEAIPGVSTALALERLQAVVAKVGCAIAGASAEIAPADRRLYAIRDVTATVDSPDLISASILAKKLAEGLSALVLDVKVGSGAFLPSFTQAESLACALVETAKAAGLACSALITSMDAPLGGVAGTALEVKEAIALLSGEGAPELRSLVALLGGEALALAGLVDHPAEGAAKIITALDKGLAADRFARMVSAQGGPHDFLERWTSYLPEAPVIRPVPAPRAGFVAKIDTRAVGWAVVALGGGRRREGDAIDPRVGFSAIAGLGEATGADRPLGLVHAQSEADAEAAAYALTSAVTIAEAAPPPAPLVCGRVE